MDAAEDANDTNQVTAVVRPAKSGYSADSHLLLCCGCDPTCDCAVFVKCCAGMAYKQADCCAGFAHVSHHVSKKMLRT